MQQFEKAEWLSLKEHPELNEKWVQELIATEQNRRGFLQVAGVAAATFTLDGLRSAAHAASEATGKMKIENVGLMSPGDMGQAVAMQIKAKGLNVYTALEQRSARTRFEPQCRTLKAVPDRISERPPKGGLFVCAQTSREGVQRSNSVSHFHVLVRILRSYELRLVNAPKRDRRRP